MMTNNWSGARLDLAYAMIVAVVLVVSLFSLPRSAQASGWEFAKEIPCADAAFSGLSMGKCWVSQMRSFRGGDGQGWKQAYSDTTSEFAVGLYKVVAIRGNGFGAVGTSTTTPISWLQNADALQPVVAGGSDWHMQREAGADFIVSFTKRDRHCIAFVRNGPFVHSAEVEWILGGALCRVSSTPLQVDEVQYLLQALKVKG